VPRPLTSPFFPNIPQGLFFPNPAKNPGKTGPQERPSTGPSSPSPSPSAVYGLKKPVCSPRKLDLKTKTFFFPDAEEVPLAHTCPPISLSTVAIPSLSCISDSFKLVEIQMAMLRFPPPSHNRAWSLPPPLPPLGQSFPFLRILFSLKRLAF